MLLAVGEVEAVAAEVSWSNTRSNVDIAKPLTFNGEVGKIVSFLMACKLFIKINIRKAAVEEQCHKLYLAYISTTSRLIFTK